MGDEVKEQRVENETTDLQCLLKTQCLTIDEGKKSQKKYYSYKKSFETEQDSFFALYKAKIFMIISVLICLLAFKF